MTQQFYSWLYIWKKSKNFLIWKDTCTLVCITALFIIAQDMEAT